MLLKLEPMELDRFVVNADTVSASLQCWESPENQGDGDCCVNKTDGEEQRRLMERTPIWQLPLDMQW